MKRHIVIIEDDPDLRSLLTKLLEDSGYRVTALQQMDSVEYLMRLQPHAFVIDEKLPVVQGHIICIILKSKPETKHIPIILMSADDKLEHKASLCEADAYLSKPFYDFQDLQRLLDKTLAA